jgi:hypothetical protein
MTNIPERITRRLCEKCGSAIGDVHAPECPVDRHAPIVEVEYVRADLPAQERQDVLNCINLYGDETLHKALDGIGWPDDYKQA